MSTGPPVPRAELYPRPRMLYHHPTSAWCRLDSCVCHSTTPRTPLEVRDHTGSVACGPCALRSAFKVTLAYLGEQSARSAFLAYFDMEAPSRLDRLDCLAPGDFEVVRRKAEVLGELEDADALVEMLRGECDAKPGGAGRPSGSVRHSRRGRESADVCASGPAQPIRRVCGIMAVRRSSAPLRH